MIAEILVWLLLSVLKESMARQGVAASCASRVVNADEQCIGEHMLDPQAVGDSYVDSCPRW